MRATSKFKHVFGQPSRKEACYENVRVTTSAHDGNFCAVNPRFVAVVAEAAGGGAFFVLPLRKVGRVEATVPRVCGHAGPINDLKWSPFDDCVIATCSDDTTVKVWRIPEHGLALNMTQWAADLRGHARRVTYIDWHPTAEHVLLSAAFDYKCIVWNTKTVIAMRVIYCHNNAIYSLSWNRDGSLFATTCKDRKIRVIDPRLNRVVQEGDCHEGLKPSKAVFVSEANKLFSTGFSKRGDREIAVWDSKDLSRPLILDTVDYSSGILLPFYDSDTHMVYAAGKGDGNIRYYEISEDPPYMRFLNQYPTSDPQRGLGWMPKRGLDLKKCEVARFYKLHANKQIIEPVSMIVPRRSNEYQEDIYPPTSAFAPSLSAEEWLAGVNRGPILVELKDLNASVTAFQSSLLTTSKQSVLSAKHIKAPAAVPAPPAAHVPGLSAMAPASLRNILKLSTDDSHVVAADLLGTGHVSKKDSNECHQPLIPQTQAVSTEPPRSAEASRMNSNRDSANSGHCRAVVPGPSSAEATTNDLCLEQSASDRSPDFAVPTRLGDDRGSAEITHPEASASSSKMLLCPSQPTLPCAVVAAETSSPDVAHTLDPPNPGCDVANAGQVIAARPGTLAVGLSGHTPTENGFVSHHRMTSLDDTKSGSTNGSPTAVNLHPQQSPERRVAPHVAGNEQKVKTWRDNSAWRQPALPVQPAAPADPVGPRRLHSGRLMQPQVVSHGLESGRNGSLLHSDPDRLISPPSEINSSNLSNDELHKAYFKQVDEIKSLRQQLVVKDKKIQQLEADLERLAKV